MRNGLEMGGCRFKENLKCPTSDRQTVPTDPLMSRKGFYERGPPEPLYGLVPITCDGELIDGGPPTPLRVFQCNSCGVLPLFPEDQ